MNPHHTINTDGIVTLHTPDGDMVGRLPDGWPTESVVKDLEFQYYEGKAWDAWEVYEKEGDNTKRFDVRVGEQDGEWLCIVRTPEKYYAESGPDKELVVARAVTKAMQDI